MIGENQGFCVFPLYIQYITNYYIIYIYIYIIYTQTSYHIHTVCQYGFNFIYPFEKHEL